MSWGCGHCIKRLGRHRSPRYATYEELVEHMREAHPDPDLAGNVSAVMSAAVHGVPDALPSNPPPSAPVHVSTPLRKALHHLMASVKERAVPGPAGDGTTGPDSPALISSRVPSIARQKRLTASTWLIEAILAKASPRNPNVRMLYRSSSRLILLVACAEKANAISSAVIPLPSSLMRISFLPPSSTSTLIRIAPASRLFSNNSFTTLAGRSTTSPAAILFIKCDERIAILAMTRFCPCLFAGN